MKRIFSLLIPAIALLPIVSCNGPTGNPSVQPASSSDNSSGATNTSDRSSDTRSNADTNQHSRDTGNYRSQSGGQNSVNNSTNAPGVNHRKDNLNNANQGTVPVGGSQPAGTDKNSSPNSHKGNRSSSDTSRRNPR